MLALGIPYVGADFRLFPPELDSFELPSLAVIGTGKRVGKTAVTVTTVEDVPTARTVARTPGSLLIASTRPSTTAIRLSAFKGFSL